MEQERTRVSKIKTLAELLTPAWYKYDANLPSVLKMMGYKTVLQYDKQNQQAANYYRVFEQFKTKPQDGVAGIYTSVNDLLASEEFRTHLWLEDNVAKYKMVKDGSSDINTIVNKIRLYLDKVKDNPYIEKVDMSYRKVAKDMSNTISGERFEYFIDLKITYDSVITYIPKNGTPFNLHISEPFDQTINIKVPRIDINVIKRGDINEIMKNLITEKSLRESFRFNGPNMYTSRNGGEAAAGCLGTRSSEFRELCKEKNLAQYINFVCDWGRTYTQGLSGPHRSPSNIVSRFKVWGFTDPNIEQGFKSVNSCQIYNSKRNTFIRVTTNDLNQLKRSTGFDNFNDVCNKCTLTTCTYNGNRPKLPKAPDSTYKTVISMIKGEHAGMQYDWLPDQFSKQDPYDLSEDGSSHPAYKFIKKAYEEYDFNSRLKEMKEDLSG